ncbi:hypothetical protein [Streptomyces chartreusis]
MVSGRACVHGRFDQPPGRGRCGAVALEQGRGSGQVLGDAPVVGVAGGVQQPRVAARVAVQSGEIVRAEGGRDGDAGAGQQVAGLCVRIFHTPVRAGFLQQLGPVLGPDGAQDQHRRLGRLAQQRAQRGGHPFSQPGARGGQVVVGVVKPDDGVRADAADPGQGGFGAAGCDGVPQPPGLGQFLDGFPAGAGFSGGGGADQHGHRAGALEGLHDALA